MIKSCLKLEFTLLLESRFSTDNILDFSRQRLDEIKKNIQLFFLKKSNHDGRI